MKVIKEVVEVKNEGFEALLGQNITIICAVYIYTGELVGVNDTCVKLRNPKIVYETGPWSDSKWKDAQSLPNDLYINRTMVESFGITK